MIMHDWNIDRKDAVLIIHPMGASAENMKKLLIDRMGDGLRYIVPDLSAHGEAAESTYENADKEAEEICSYLRGNDLLKLKLAYGASLGGVILLRLIGKKDVEADHCFFEGTSFLTDSAFFEKFNSFVFLKMRSKGLKKPESLVKIMEKSNGKEFGKDFADHLTAMSEASIRNMVHDCGYVVLPKLNSEKQSRCIFAYGSKETNYKKAKKLIPEMYPDAKLCVWEGYSHCGRLMLDTDQYAAMLKQLV